MFKSNFPSSRLAEIGMPYTFSDLITVVQRLVVGEVLLVLEFRRLDNVERIAGTLSALSRRKIKDCRLRQPTRVVQIGADDIHMVLVTSTHPSGDGFCPENPVAETNRNLPTFSQHSAHFLYYLHWFGEIINANIAHNQVKTLVRIRQFRVDIEIANRRLIESRVLLHLNFIHPYASNHTPSRPLQG